MTIVIPAYSLQRVPYLLQCNEKGKNLFSQKRLEDIDKCVES